MRTKALRDEAASRRLGLEEGEIKGKIESAKLIANSMKKDGIKISMIIKYTGLSRREIEELK